MLTRETSAGRQYARRMLVSLFLYFIVLVGCQQILYIKHPSYPVTIILSILPSLPIIAVIGIVGMYLREERDEFVRDLTAQTLLWGMGLTLATTSIWGFLEMFADVRRLPAFYVFVLFWMFTGFANYPLKRYYGRSND